jgi:hypothetical protein
MIKKKKLNSFYALMPFKYHQEIKNQLLDFISDAEYKSPKEAAAEVNITKADWHNATNMHRPWVQHIAKSLLEELAVLYKEIGFDSLEVKEIWFQQYLTGSEHGWHTHSSNFTNVYYLEMPKGTPPTQIVSPYDRTKIIEVDAKEGDLLVFPSYVLHKAPVNKSNKRKTIISYNIDAMVSDKMYGVGIGVKK